MLTDTALRRLRPDVKPYKLADGGGLHILVQPTGGKLWRLAYRFEGKQLTLALGAYPAVSLADARLRREAAKVSLARGERPKPVRVRKAEPPQITFETVAREWFKANTPSWKPSYSTRIEARLERDVYPEIGALALDKITGLTLLKLFRQVEARGAVHIAKRLKNHCGEIFRYAMAEGRATADPTAGLERALVRVAPVKHRARLSAAELPEFFQALAAFEGEETTRLAIKLTMLTFVRTSEVRFARWAEFDLAGALWRIPGSRMKMGLEHLVPLAPQTLAVLEAVKSLSGGSEYLFPYPGRYGVISENRMIFALYRMGYHTRATVHGFRGTASTILNEKGFNKDWVERQLAHVDGDAVRSAYNAAEYLGGRRKMMHWWASFLDVQQGLLPVGDFTLEPKDGGGS
jgi:integrase